MDKFMTHEKICKKLTELYKRKNHDYGDSFGKSFVEYGMTMPCIRLEDKLNRLKALTRKDAEVMDETIDDTLMDLANYAIMTLVERELDATQIVHKRLFYFPGCDACAKCWHFDKHQGPEAAACQNCESRHSIISKEVTY